MNRNMNDNEFDAMVKNYCRRSRQTAFDADVKNTKSGVKRMKWGAFVVPAVAFVLVFGFVVLQVFGVSNKIQNSGTTPKGFYISASAAEREPVALENVEVELCPKEEKGLGGDIAFEDGMISLEPIWFNMNGEDVETFDYKCENGLLYYVIPDLKNEMLEGDSTITQDDYYKKSKELKSIPYKSDTENYIFVSWFSLKLDEEASEYFGTDIAQVDDAKLRNYRTEHLKTKEDFNKYFGDTITVTAHYKDGTSETAVIEITVDTWEDGNKTYGNYVLKYK